MRNVLLRKTLLTAVLLTLPVIGSAQTLRITPALIDAAHSVEEALTTHKGHASTTIQGQGGTVTIDYQSSESLEVYLVPLHADASYTLTDYLRFTLPMATEGGTVSIDLTMSPGWSPKQQTWLLNLLSTDEKTNAAFTKMSFDDANQPNAAIIALRHLFTEEIYTPSSYHALRGYKMLDVSFTVLLGLVTVIGALGCLIFLREQKRKTGAMLMLILGMLLYQMRFSVDLVRYTAQHLTEYSHGTYDEAGSIHAVAAFLHTLAKGKESTLTVYVCRDGTNFKEKLLRYFSYPIRISSETEDTKNAQYAVVMDKFKWGFETIVTKENASTLLKCGDLERRSEKLTTFRDGTIVFRLLPSPKKF